MGLRDYVGSVGSYDLRYEVGNVEGLLVDVYKNLHTGRWSIRVVSGEWRGKVIAHADEVYLKDVSFIVNEVGRQRVIDRKRKEVHAYVRGRLSLAVVAEFIGGDEVYYNPYVTSEFVCRESNVSVPGLCGDVVFLNGGVVKFIESGEDR